MELWKEEKDGCTFFFLLISSLHHFPLVESTFLFVLVQLGFSLLIHFPLDLGLILQILDHEDNVMMRPLKLIA